MPAPSRNRVVENDAGRAEPVVVVSSDCHAGPERPRWCRSCRPRLMSPEELVRAVFDRVHASDPAVSDLYAEDAVRYGHDGRVYEGRSAIAGFYQSISRRRRRIPSWNHCS